ncbi:hypothetical protein EUGRSUZ_H01460 [Eucalyptus grandis]|uniref:Uncharacterized protein n=2 Tax=Eucalyptus grandis TaxID=71139 RepID=A0ACC3JQH0_EUCGR|nr:hypothetical protein EUGRSUZ_H01460 [Eucalyptus grandis]
MHRRDKVGHFDSPSNDSKSDRFELSRWLKFKRQHVKIWKFTGQLAKAINSPQCTAGRDLRVSLKALKS